MKRANKWTGLNSFVPNYIYVRKLKIIFDLKQITKETNAVGINNIY